MKHDDQPIAASAAGPLLDEARRLGVYAIVREQTKRAYVVSAQGGKIEEVGATHAGGVGMHVFTDEGFSAFGCADGFDVEEAVGLMRRTAQAAGAAKELGGERDASLLQAAPLTLHMPDERTDRFDAIALDALERDVLRVHESVRAIAQGIRV